MFGWGACECFVGGAVNVLKLEMFLTKIVEKNTVVCLTTYCTAILAYVR